MAADASPGWMVPSVRLWRMRLSQVAVAGPGLAVVAGVAAGMAVSAWAGAVAAALVAVAAGVVLWVERRRYRAWAYRERDEDLIVSRGVLVRRVSVVPYGRMQYVEITAGPFERAHAAFRDRPADQARELLDELAALGRRARSAEASGAAG